MTTPTADSGLKDFELGLLRNQFLIAMPGMNDTSFAQSVTYICEHSADGAMGLVINHPTPLTLGDIFQQLELKQRSEERRVGKSVDIGGSRDIRRTKGE